MGSYVPKHYGDEMSNFLQKNSIISKVSLFFLFCIAAISLLYFTLGHALIDAMYHGKAWGHLNNVTKSKYSLNHYLTEGDWFVAGLIVCVCALWLLSVLSAVPQSVVSTLHKLQKNRKTTGLLALFFFALVYLTAYYQPLTPMGLFACWLGLVSAGLFWMKTASTLAMGRLAYAALLAVFLFPSLFWIVTSPRTLSHMFDEDTFGENLSVLIPAFASFLFFRLFFSRKIEGEKRNYFYLFFGSFLFFIAAEEFTWGQRVLGLKTPEAWQDINVQGELNLHNLKWFDPNSLVTLILFVFGIAIPAVNRISKSFKTFLKKISFPVFPPAACVAVVIGLTFDLIWRLGFYHQADEIRELFLYFGFLYLAFNLYLGKVFASAVHFQPARFESISEEFESERANKPDDRRGITVWPNAVACQASSTMIKKSKIKSVTEAVLGRVKDPLA